MQVAIEQQVSFARGMNNTAAPTEFRADEVALLLNGRVSFDGNAVEPRMGSKRTHATALNSGAQGYGGIEYYTAAGQQQICVFVGDKFYTSTDEGATWTQRATGLSTAYWSIVTMRVGSANYLIAANGSTSIYYWDGDSSTWGTLTGAPTNAKFLAVFNERLYVAGHSGVTVAASKVRDPNTWAAPDGFTVQAETHDGDQEITGLYQMGAVLVVYKRHSTGYIEGFGYQTLQVEEGARGISRSVGCIAFNSIRATGDQGVCWLSERGIEFWQIGGPIVLVSRPIANFMSRVSWDTIEGVPGGPSSLFWPLYNEYFLALPSASSQNDYVVRWRPPTNEAPPCIVLDRHQTADEALLVVTDANGDLDIRSDGTGRFVRLLSGDLDIAPAGTPGLYVQVDSNGDLDLATNDHDHSVLFSADRTTDGLLTAPWAIGYDGFVRRLEVGTKDNVASDDTEGETVTPQVRSRPMLFGQPMRAKRARSVRIASTQSAATTFTLGVLADGETKSSSTLTAPAAIGDQPKTTRKRTTGRGLALQAEVALGVGQTLAGIEITAQPKREPR